MGKYNSNRLTTKFVQDYMKDKLWERDNSDYVPFLNVRSVPTKGKANRIMGWRTCREHHFLSKLEYAAFFYFDWSDEVIDIKEQYPLFPLEVLQNIALEAGIEYPNFNGEPIVMTTDFLIKANKNSKIIQYARTVKSSTDLANERIIEKFEIERRYFNSKKIDWGIITEKELSDVFISNMEVLHSNKLINNESILEKDYIFTMYRQLVMFLEKFTTKNMPITYALAQLSRDLNINLININELFFKAIVDKILVLDIYNLPLNITELTLSDIKINNEMLLRAVNMQ
jgi:hypothetical protein